VTFAPIMFPAANRTVFLGPENVASGTAATAFTACPVAGLTPSDKQAPLEDKSLRGAQSEVFGLQFGPRWTELAIPESPVYLDFIGMLLKNICGDYYSSGTAGSPTWTTSAPLTPGAGPIPVATGSSAVAGTYVQIDSSTNSEVVKVGTGSTTTSIVVDATTPVRFSHLTSIAVVTVVAPFTHNFSQLCPGSSTGVTDGQPPTHTLIDKTYIPGSGNNNARQYAFFCAEALNFTGKNSGWFSWDGKAKSLFTAYAASPPVASFSTAKPQPSWRSTVTVGGVARNEIEEWSVRLKRGVDPEPTADGSQDPYTFARGLFGADWTLDYLAIDETGLTNYISNVQPTLAWAITNGLSGANLLSMTISAQLGAYKGSDIDIKRTLFGYKASGSCISNVTNAGNSGGYSPVAITLSNAVATY